MDFSTFSWGFGGGACVGVLIGAWLARAHRPKGIDPYPGGDALKEYVESEFEHQPSDGGEQPKDGSNG